MSPDPFSGLAFSTSWNWRSSSVGREIMEGIRTLGFRQVELNYKITRSMLDTIAPMVARGEITVVSVHNVFPDVADERFDTDSRLLGYADAGLRQRSVELACRSMDAGADLGARAVVIHPGEIPAEGVDAAGTAGLSGAAWDKELKRLYRERGHDSEEYRTCFSDFVAHRSRLSAPETERIIESLQRIAEYALRVHPGMAVGVENRAMCHQIPDFVEARRILDALDGSPVGFWFDTGHGAMMRNLGFFDDRTEAAGLTDRIVGVHIHDVDGVDDHWAPYSKGDGLDGYLDVIDRAPIKVIEVGMKNRAKDIVRGVSVLARKLDALDSCKERGRHS